MRRTLVLSESIVAFLAIGCGGCDRSRPTQPEPPPLASEKPLRARVVGKWATSTNPEMAATATTISFLESGEYQATGLFQVGGQPLLMEKDGKKVLISITLSGTWDLDGDTIRVRITQTSLPGGQFAPFTYKVREAGEKRLLMDKDDEEVAVFRVE
jgi:hypothetical protein